MSLSSAGTLSGTPTSAGTFVFIVTASDSSGDTDSQAYSLTITNASTTAVTGPATTVSGQPATFTVSVTVSGPTPTGLVTLYDGSNVIASGNLNNRSVSFLTSTLPLGSHTLTAVYNGDSNYAASTSPGLGVSVVSPNFSDTFNNGNFNGTTIAVGSDGVSLPTSTLYVASTAGFAPTGQLAVQTTAGYLLVNYTGLTSTFFAGVSGGAGLGAVLHTGYTVQPTFSANWTVAPNPTSDKFPGVYAISNNQAVAEGTQHSSAIINGFGSANVSVSAFLNLSAATPTNNISAGVLARRDSNNNAYVGELISDGTNMGVALGIAQGFGGFTLLPGTNFVLLGSGTSGVLQLDVSGTSLKLYFNGQLEIGGTDATLPAAGGVGIYSEEGGAVLTNFSAYELLPAPVPFTDNFTRANALTLGDPWSVDQGGFSISGNQAVAATGVQSEATLYGAQLTTVDESVNVIGQGTSAGLLARWNSATQTGYEVILSGTTVSLYRVLNGTATLLTSASTGGGSTGVLRFKVSTVGSNAELQVWVGSNPLMDYTDTTPVSGSGAVGLFSGGSSAFGTFTVNGS